MHEEIAREGDPVGDLRRRVESLTPLGVSFFLVNAWPKTDHKLIEEAAQAIADLR